jgi:hypothetical protein
MRTWNSRLLAGAVAAGAGALLFLGLALPSQNSGGNADDLMLSVETATEEAGEPQKGATGDPIACAGGETLLTSFAQKGDDFVLVATFQDVAGGGLLVEGPGGETAVSLARSPTVQGEYYGGEAMIISGKVTDDNRLEATGIEPACPQFFVQEIETDAPEPTPPAQPTSPPATESSRDSAEDDHSGAAFVILRDEGDDDDRYDGRDKDNEGRGNRDEGRGHRSNDDRDDDDDSDDDDND